jgi:RNA polymerase sigma-70 factor (ECF subfamily)
MPSLRAIYDEHAPYVLRCLRYLGVRAADLDDAAQETFVIASRKLADLRPDTSYRAWLYAIALNVARHARRARTGLPLEDAEPATLDGSRRVEARSELIALLSVLDDDKREVIVLYHLEQLTLREIAAVAGCPLQTVYSRLQAGTKQLEAARWGSKEEA